MVMEKLHGASTSWASKFLFGFITVTFVISSMAGYLYTRVDNSAAKVNGEEISQHTFQNQYNAASRNLSPQDADSPAQITQLKTQILASLINQELLRQYANDLKLGVSDDRVKQEIVTTPSFQNNGKFDNTLYQQMLQSNGISAETYAGYVREALRLEQLQNALAATMFSVPVQQEALEKLFFQRRQVRFAKLSLLDEIEKAHPNVLTALLQVLDEGILRDERNREVSFRDTIIVATSNAGADRIRELIERGYSANDTESIIVNDLINSREFRPEFLNRFDEVVVFEPLTKENLLQIIDIMLASVNKMLAGQKITVEVEAEAKRLLAELGYDPQLGARPMRRVIQKVVENTIARKMLSGEATAGSNIIIDENIVRESL